MASTKDTGRGTVKGAFRTLFATVIHGSTSFLAVFIILMWPGTVWATGAFAALGAVVGGLLKDLTVIALRELARRRNNPNRTVDMAIDLHPPRGGKFCLWLLPKKVRGNAIGDLEEEFHEVQAEFGRKKARAWYWAQVILTVGAALSGCVKWMVDLLKQPAK